MRHNYFNFIKQRLYDTGSTFVRSLSMAAITQALHKVKQQSTEPQVCKNVNI